MRLADRLELAVPAVEAAGEVVAEELLKAGQATVVEMALRQIVAEVHHMKR